MQFGIREICDVVFKAKNAGKLGSYSYVAGQPVLYIDSAKTSTLEGSSVPSYATGGKGNTRLITWEGERTLTFTVEDALLSEVGFALLSGAGLFTTGQTINENVVAQANAEGEIYVMLSKNAKSITSIVDAEGTAYTGTLDSNNAKKINFSDVEANVALTVTYVSGEKVYIHTTAPAQVGADGTIDLTDALRPGEKISDKSPVFVMAMKYGSLNGMISGLTVDGNILSGATGHEGESVFVDFYIEKDKDVTEITIDSDNFGGYYYVEASTLFRRQADGKDLAAELVFPNVKVQSNFTFAMSSSGDPSTFSFVMDAMPGYTRFDRTKKVLCAMYVVDEDANTEVGNVDSVNNLAHGEETYPTDSVL